MPERESVSALHLVSVWYGAGYPEAYFGRLALPADAVMAVVSACRADDIYNQARGRRSPCVACIKTCGRCIQAHATVVCVLFAPSL